MFLVVHVMVEAATESILCSVILSSMSLAWCSWVLVEAVTLIVCNACFNLHFHYFIGVGLGIGGLKVGLIRQILRLQYSDIGVR